MKKIILIGIMFTLLIMSADALMGKSCTVIDVKVPCFNNNTYCSDDAICNMTILDPDYLILTQNTRMSYQDSFFNHTLLANQTCKTGDYPITMVCDDRNQTGFTSFFLTVTPNGELLTGGKAISYLGFLALIVLGLIGCVVGYLHSKPKPNFVGRYSYMAIAYVLGIAFIFISWHFAQDFLTSSPFIISFLKILFRVIMVGFFPFILMLLIFLVLNMMKIKEIQNMIKRGTI